MNRRWWLWGALAATLVATWYASGLQDSPDDEALLAAPRTDRPRSGVVAPMAAASSPRDDRPATPPDAGTAGSPRTMGPKSPLMAAHDWRPPPPPPPRPAAAPPPQAPPLPFRYLGRMDDGDGGFSVFLADGSLPRPLVVRGGERIRDYQVQSVSPRGVTFVYLPLNQQQQMLFGSQP